MWDRSSRPCGAAATRRRRAQSEDAGRVEFGGFWIRVLASQLDFLIAVMVAVAAWALLGLIGLLVTSVLLLLYHPVMESSEWQATLGKRICGLAVIEKHGQRISFGRAVVRQFAKFLSAIPLYLGFVMVGIDAQKRGLHDLIAGTLVARR